MSLTFWLGDHQSLGAEPHATTAGQVACANPCSWSSYNFPSCSSDALYNALSCSLALLHAVWFVDILTTKFPKSECIGPQQQYVGIWRELCFACKFDHFVTCWLTKSSCISWLVCVGLADWISRWSNQAGPILWKSSHGAPTSSQDCPDSAFVNFVAGLVCCQLGNTWQNWRRQWSFLMCGSAWFGAHHVVIDSKSYISNDHPDWNEIFWDLTSFVSSRVISRRRLKCLMKFRRRCC